MHSTFAHTPSSSHSRVRFQLRPLCWLVALLLLAACGPLNSDADIGGRLLLWHSQPTSASAIEAIVADFEAIYPGVEVVIQIVPQDAIQARYQNSAAFNLGPDLLIGSTRWIPEWAEAQIIADIAPLDPSMERYLSAAVQNVRYEDGIYGIPFALEPAALYYNRTRVETTPATLDELLAQAAAGHSVGLVTRFEGGFWGVQSLGGQLFDEEGRVLLDQGGFASWLNWLQAAQRAPGMTLGRDSAALLDLFLRGELDYVVGTPDDLPQVREALGVGNYGVAALPSGAGGASGPLLNVDALLFNRATSDETRRAALTLAQFLTNDEQSTALIRTRAIVPANRGVQPNARLYPGIAGFATQARTAVAIPNTDAMEQVLELGDTLLQQVLSGVLLSSEAASTITQEVNAASGFDLAEADATFCTLSGDLRLWHSWGENRLAALEAIVADYETRCRNVTIDLVNLRSEAAVLRGFEAVAGTSAAPTALLVSSEAVRTLAFNDQIALLMPPDTQQYSPASLETLRVRNALYGLPISIETNALYYNTDQITDPAATLDDLLTAARAGIGVALPRRFWTAYWGAPAYGATLFDATGRVTLDAGGFTEWLTWMQQMSTQPSVMLGTDQANRAAFASGTVAYYVGPPAALPEFQAALGSDTVRAIVLPSGPVAAAAPILTTSALVVSSGQGEQVTEIAIDFGAFLTDIQSQQILLEEAQQVPANVNVVLEERPNFAPFRQQSLRTTVLPNIPQVEALLEEGDRVYRAVLDEGVPPAEAVANFVASVNEANGFAPLTPTPPVTASLTPPEGIPPTPAAGTTVAPDPTTEE